jgi:hypothetical protein
MKAEDTPSSYTDGKTQGQVAQEMADNLIRDAKAGTLSRSDSYGLTNMRAKEYTLAGGGPGADVLILIRDGEPVGGYLNYYEANGVTSVYLDERAAELIEKDLNHKGDDEDE